jgi:hypothetical protein
MAAIKSVIQALTSAVSAASRARRCVGFQVVNVAPLSRSYSRPAWAFLE